MKNKKSEAKQKPSSSSSYNDERFTHIPNNPIFRKVPAKEKRIDVDERFHSMFHDSKFNLNSKVDKRGKPITAKSDKRLATYYSAVGAEKKEKTANRVSKDLQIKGKSKSKERNVEHTTPEEKLDESQSDSSAEEDSSSGDEELEEKNDEDLGKYKSTLSADVKKKNTRCKY